MKLKRGPSRFWSVLHRLRLVRAHMPFWRVVVEAKPDRRARRWPPQIESAVAAVFVWARTIEEAEALASLAIEAEGFEFVTADAVKQAPAARPRREPGAVARSEIGFVTRRGKDARQDIANLLDPRT